MVGSGGRTGANDSVVATASVAGTLSVAVGARQMATLPWQGLLLRSDPPDEDTSKSLARWQPVKPANQAGGTPTPMRMLSVMVTLPVESMGG